ncbi:MULTISPECIES: hypothetical protein [unclassified Acinetobacter]|uniref:hypothetical protein n=1 Tax=unclassified Acinetobacter TaxID=196816 RepID=UPI001C065346|nr:MULTISPECIES: hypothetical protein [unclassified Acinetobacter]
MSTSRVKLTKSFIDQLKLIPAIYRDSEIIGFAIRVNNRPLAKVVIASSSDLPVQRLS